MNNKQSLQKTERNKRHSLQPWIMYNEPVLKGQRRRPVGYNRAKSLDAALSAIISPFPKILFPAYSTRFSFLHMSDDAV
jgi:hypothetical protein